MSEGGPGAPRTCLPARRAAGHSGRAAAGRCPEQLPHARPPAHLFGFSSSNLRYARRAMARTSSTGHWLLWVRMPWSSPGFSSSVLDAGGVGWRQGWGPESRAAVDMEPLSCVNTAGPASSAHPPREKLIMSGRSTPHSPCLLPNHHPLVRARVWASPPVNGSHTANVAVLRLLQPVHCQQAGHIVLRAGSEGRTYWLAGTGQAIAGSEGAQEDLGAHAESHERQDCTSPVHHPAGLTSSP